MNSGKFKQLSLISSPLTKSRGDPIKFQFYSLFLTMLCSTNFHEKPLNIIANIIQSLVLIKKQAVNKSGQVRPQKKTIFSNKITYILSQFLEFLLEATQIHDKI
jgi:hypothetical protein